MHVPISISKVVWNPASNLCIYSFCLLYWNDCRILLIIYLNFLLLTNLPHAYISPFIIQIHRGSGIVENQLLLRFKFLKITSSSVLMDDILLTNAAKSHAINHGKGCFKLADKYQWKPSPTFSIGNIMIIITEMP